MKNRVELKTVIQRKFKAKLKYYSGKNKFFINKMKCFFSQSSLQTYFTFIFND